MLSQFSADSKVGKNSQIECSGIKREHLQRIRLDVGNDCHVTFKSYRSINGKVSITMQNNAQLFLGEEQAFNGDCAFQLYEPSSITVGNQCLWAFGLLTTSDYHSIIDISSGQRLNMAKDIVIGEHVWFCRNYLVLKGANIGKDSVVGANAVIKSGTYESNAVLSGNPAVVVRRNISWDINLI